MSVKRRALRKALRTAHRAESGAAALYHAWARNLGDAQLHGTFLQFAAQEQGAVAMVEGLLDARGMAKPLSAPLARLRATVHGTTARLRPWRSVMEDAVERTEGRVRRLAEAGSYARLAGDLDAARSLDDLRDAALAQGRWFSDFLR